MPASHLEREALAYWNGAKRFRLMSRMGQDTSELSDDLGVIAMYSGNHAIRRDIGRVLGRDTAMDAAK